MTLVQTGKSPRPILLFGASSGTRLIDFDWLVETGMISPGDEACSASSRPPRRPGRCWPNYGFDLPETTTGEFADDI